MAQQRMRPAGSGLFFRKRDGGTYQVAFDDLIDDAERQRFFGLERIAGENR